MAKFVLLIVLVMFSGASIARVPSADPQVVFLPPFARGAAPNDLIPTGQQNSPCLVDGMSFNCTDYKSPGTGKLYKTAGNQTQYFVFVFNVTRQQYEVVQKYTLGQNGFWSDSQGNMNAVDLHNYCGQINTKTLLGSERYAQMCGAVMSKSVGSTPPQPTIADTQK